MKKSKKSVYNFFWCCDCFFGEHPHVIAKFSDWDSGPTLRIQMHNGYRTLRRRTLRRWTLRRRTVRRRTLRRSFSIQGGRYGGATRYSQITMAATAELRRNHNPKPNPNPNRTLSLILTLNLTLTLSLTLSTLTLTPTRRSVHSNVSI